MTRMSLSAIVLAQVVVFGTAACDRAAAGPIEDFYALEEKMAEAHELYADAHGGAAHETGAKLPDPRLGILEKIDKLADATLDQPAGASIAGGAFYWSWNLDLDLKKLHARFDRLAKHHPDNASLDDVLGQAAAAALGVGPADAWAKSLERLAKASKREKTQIKALVALGQVQLGTKHAAAAKTAFEKILKISTDADYVKLAKGYIFEIEHLQVGMVAPGFAGKTLDGKEVSLKSLRGKVVLLDFWATWCAPCVAELPHLKEAAARLKDRPFEILSVSLDDEREGLESVVKAVKFPGIKLWDPKGWENPVSALYNVQSIPAWFLIDAKGVIRARDMFGPALMPAIEKALGGAPGTRVGVSSNQG